MIKYTKTSESRKPSLHLWLKGQGEEIEILKPGRSWCFEGRKTAWELSLTEGGMIEAREEIRNTRFLSPATIPTVSYLARQESGEDIPHRLAFLSVEKCREEVMGREWGGIGQNDLVGDLIKDLEYQVGYFHKSHKFC